MPDQIPPRRPFRLLRWSLFGLALVGLGFLLQDWLSPWPRCTIPFKSPFNFGFNSPDGHFLATGPLGGPLVGGLESPIQFWDTRSGKLQGNFLKGTGAGQHEFSPNFKYIAAWDGTPDAVESNFYLLNLQKKSLCANCCAISHPPPHFFDGLVNKTRPANQTL